MVMRNSSCSRALALVKAPKVMDNLKEKSSGRSVKTPSTAGSWSTAYSEDVHVLEEWELGENSAECNQIGNIAEQQTEEAQVQDEKVKIESFCASDRCQKEDEDDSCFKSTSRIIVEESSRVSRSPLNNVIETSRSVRHASSARSIKPTARTEVTETNASAEKSRRIQVFIRIRPVSASTSDNNDTAVTRGDTPNSILVRSSSLNGFTRALTECQFDKVFAPEAQQTDIFDAIRSSMDACIAGYNCTIFGYGQTSTGKTYTIFGSDFDQVSCDDLSDIAYAANGYGIIPRALAYLLDQATLLFSEGIHLHIDISVLQIYNDRLFDLLSDPKKLTPLVMRELPNGDGRTDVTVQDAIMVRVTSCREGMALLQKAMNNRSVRATEMNAGSSRSHAIVQIGISVEKRTEEGNLSSRKSRLNLVDLAGSEKWSTSGNMEEMHIEEMKKINTSLSALGNTIAALSEGRTHIPFRDSTLTRLLQDSLGGNTQTTLIATISPQVRASEETLRTLQFADRAKSVMQTTRVNDTVDGGVSELALARLQIRRLKERVTVDQRKLRAFHSKEKSDLSKRYEAELRAKEDEANRLRKDIAVFQKWREDDTKTIRKLEKKVKELEATISQLPPVQKLVDGSFHHETTGLNNQNEDDGRRHLGNSASLPEFVGTHREACSTELPLGKQEAYHTEDCVPADLNRATHLPELPDKSRVLDTDSQDVVQASFKFWVKKSNEGTDSSWGESCNYESPYLPKACSTRAMSLESIGRQQTYPTSKQSLHVNSIHHQSQIFMAEHGSSEHLQKEAFARHDSVASLVKTPARPPNLSFEALQSSTRMKSLQGSCEKHNLHACVLCSLSSAPTISKSYSQPLFASSDMKPCSGLDTKSCFELDRKISNDVKSSPVSMLSVAGVCPKHKLPSCFLCTRTGGSSTETIKSTTYDASSTRCKTHSLSSCVLCGS